MSITQGGVMVNLRAGAPIRLAVCRSPRAKEFS